MEIVVLIYEREADLLSYCNTGKSGLLNNLPRRFTAGLHTRARLGAWALTMDGFHWGKAEVSNFLAGERDVVAAASGTALAAAFAEFRPSFHLPFAVRAWGGGCMSGLVRAL